MSKPDGAERLRKWMKKNCPKQKEFGELVGAHQTAVSTWLQGRTPSLAMALRIREMTDIPVECWGDVGQDLRRRSA